MHRWSRLALPLAVVVAATAPTAAQQGPAPERVAAGEELLARCGPGARLRWCEETGGLASASLGEGLPLVGADPHEALRAALERDLAPLLDSGLRVVGPRLSRPPLGPHLALKERRPLGEGRWSLRYEQRCGALPVLDAGLVAEVEASAAGWRLVSLSARVVPDLPARLGSEAATAAEAEVLEALTPCDAADLEVQPTWERAVVSTPEGPRRALVAQWFDPEASTTWRATFDSETGAELSRERVGCCALARGLAYDKNPGQTPRAAVPLRGLYVFQGNQRVTTDDKGAHALNGMVSLDQGLAGPLLRVFVSRREELTYVGPADIDLRPDEAASAQDELAAWHHVTDFNAHLAARYARFAASPALRTRFALIVRYTRNGSPFPNAFFSPQPANGGGESFPAGWIAMGTFAGGRREAARSSSVVQHEYCHALFSRVVRLSGSLQAGGLNEGLADYLPAAFKNDPVLGAWLAGSNGIRDLRRDYRWPRDDNGDVHRVGHIFAGALWDAREAAEQRAPGGRRQVDQAVVEGIFRLRDRPTLLDAREAILAGDRAVNGGAQRVILAQAFADHGIGPAPGNAAPAFGTLQPLTLRAGETVDLAVPVTDADGDPIALTVTPVPNATLDAANLRWSFSPDRSQVGRHQVTFTASDGAESESATLDLEVLPAATSPGSGGSGSLAPVGSGSVAAPSTASGGGGGGGGGGCSLRPRAPNSAGTAGFLALALLLLWILRRRAAEAPAPFRPRSA
ncbi:MAG: hypothetical protein D6731_22945 [Planctomycetota bacterium]|nr:MAG: hypothetical protein D6731_22945 [Planctomycetota bacterium]